MTDGTVMDSSTLRRERDLGRSSPVTIKSLEYSGGNDKGDPTASSAASLLATLRGNVTHAPGDAVSCPIHDNSERERTLVERRGCCNFSPIVPTSRSSGSAAMSAIEDEEEVDDDPPPPSVEMLNVRLVQLPSVCPGLTSFEVTLRRPSLRDRWGLFVAVFDSSHLVVGATLDGYYPSPGYDVGTDGRCDPSTSTIHPGDVVVSLNGMAVSRLGGTLHAVTSYLGSVTRIDLVILRHTAATRAAEDVLRKDATGIDGGASSSARAAEAAYEVMRGVLHRYYVQLGHCQHPEQVSPTVPPLVTERGPAPDHTCGSEFMPGDDRGGGSCFCSSACHADHKAPTFVHSRGSAFSVVAPAGTTSFQWSTQRRSDQRASSQPSPRTTMWGRSSADGVMASSSFSPSSTAHCFGRPSRRNLLIREDFDRWLRERKSQWRIRRGVPAGGPADVAPPLGKTTMVNTASSTLSFSELVTIMDPERDGTRAGQFMDKLVQEDFPRWLSSRKSTWRKKWDIRATSPESVEIEILPETEFWRSGGFVDFRQWLTTRQGQWRRGYSWHVRKRKRLEIECEQVVGLPADPEAPGAEECFRNWLRIRRNQWKVMRRKRQRRLQDEAKNHHSHESSELAVDSETSNVGTKVVSTFNESEKAVHAQHPCAPTNHSVLHSSEIQQIDELLEEQEQRQRELDSRPPMDISFIFDARLGAPDDVICYCLRFLHPSEHGKLLCISRGTSDAMKERTDMWRNLCPSHWRIPRRARKPWHSLYFVNLRKEAEEAMKRSDEVLTAGARIVSKGDHLHKLEKLVKQAEKKFSFSVDYVSSVVLERNSILNIAVIHQRHKIVKWLVEAKGADIETFDRGQFTPLLNAAWGGDKYLVRFLLSHGADRTKVGTGHSSQRLAPPDFEGMNAEGWAKERGHHNLAELLRLGLA